MRALYIAVPLPPPQRWKLLRSDRCPEGHAVILAAKVAGAAPLPLRMPPGFADLVQLYLGMDDAERERLLMLGRQVRFLERGARMSREAGDPPQLEGAP